MQTLVAAATGGQFIPNCQVTAIGGQVATFNTIAAGMSREVEAIRGNAADSKEVPAGESCRDV